MWAVIVREKFRNSEKMHSFTTEKIFKIIIINRLGLHCTPAARSLLNVSFSANSTPMEDSDSSEKYVTMKNRKPVRLCRPCRGTQQFKEASA